ncbi:MAG TPA: MFS transporter [Acidimicrobiales bacterium]|nr:MFS transporter [Acidimicrobiales bacterium]
MQTETSRPRLSLAIISLVLFVTFLDNTIVAVALSNIQTDLHAGIQALQWVVSGYALTFAGLMLAFGTIGDRFGRRGMMGAGLVVFVAGSLIGSFASSVGMLIGARVIMGVGAAASEPGTLSMIRQLYPDRADRARALGVWSAISGLALAAGPVIGGVLVGLWSWRLVFVFNIVIGVIALIGVRAVLPETTSESHSRLDERGFFWAAAAVTAAVFATILGETDGYRTWWIILLYAAAVVALVAFVVVERQAEEPALDLRFFRNGGFTSGMVIAFTGFFATFAVFFFIPLFIELLGTTSPYQLALDFAPMAIALILASAWSGKWIARVGPTLPMTAGGLAAGAGIFITDAFITPSSGLGLFGWSLAIVGAGLGVVMVGATASVLSAVPSARSGMAASAVNTSRELGAVAGVTILGAIVNAQLTTNLLQRLKAIPDLPPSMRNQVIVAVTTGNTSTGSLPKTPAITKIINEVIAAAEKSFSSGLDMVLILSASLMIASGALALLLGRRGATPATEPELAPPRQVERTGRDGRP